MFYFSNFFKLFQIFSNSLRECLKFSEISEEIVLNFLNRITPRNLKKVLCFSKFRHLGLSSQQHFTIFDAAIVIVLSIIFDGVYKIHCNNYKTMHISLFMIYFDETLNFQSSLMFVLFKEKENYIISV